MLDICEVGLVFWNQFLFSNSGQPSLIANHQQFIANCCKLTIGCCRQPANCHL